jgi:hypothetical protein
MFLYWDVLFSIFMAPTRQIVNPSMVSFLDTCLTFARIQEILDL